MPGSSADLQNRFARRAMLLNQTQDEQARRLAAAIDQPPADSKDVSSNPAELARLWHFSPSPTPEQDFWQIHDQTLQQNLAQLGSGADPAAEQAAHNDAETKALQAVYPARAELVGIGTRVIDDQVKQAARIKRIVDGQTGDQSGGGQ